jgi:hypothetical protein
MNNDNLSLNLIAIAIFLMTLSSLLSPILNISPFIPAIATFSILSLITVDTLALQNKGITILLELLSSGNVERKQRILHHEAGHFLVAYLLEIPVTGYALTAWESLKQGQPGIAGVRFAPIELNSKIISDRYCTVWMAGIAAEMLIYGNAQGGTDDREKFTLVLMNLKQKDITTEQRWSIMQAKNLIEQHQIAYQELVKSMEQKKSVAECYQILKKYNTPI